jgi:hypothetical protein
LDIEFYLNPNIMKKSLSKPGFECVFALSLMAIIGLPPLVFGQNKKDDIVKKRIEIKINDGDTVVNGKNIKELSGKEREEALNHIISPNGERFSLAIPDGRTRQLIIKRKGGKADKNATIEQSFDINGGEMRVFADGADFNTDSNDNIANVHISKFRGVPDATFSIQADEPVLAAQPVMSRFTFARPFESMGGRNTQSFNYNSTDNEGISTHVSYRVNDAPKEKLSSIAGTEKAVLELKDISLSPEFSTGKTILNFNLPAKTAADVQFKDSQGKILWTDKVVNGAFSKTFSLGLNGAYYLQVKQGGNIALKRIVKED